MSNHQIISSTLVSIYIYSAILQLYIQKQKFEKLNNSLHKSNFKICMIMKQKKLQQSSQQYQRQASKIIKMQENTLVNHPLSLNYIQIAQQIHKMDVYQRLYQLFNNFQVIQHVFINQCQKSQKLLFVACEMLSKKILNYQLLLSADDLQNFLPSTNTQKSKQAMSIQKKQHTLLNISTKLYQMINNSTYQNIPEYIIRSCMNTISLCVHGTIANNSNFEIIFLNYFKMLIPDFQYNEAFIKQMNEGLPIFIQPSRDILGMHHRYVIEILTSVLDYVINSAYFVNYYYFRRNLYSFRNNYLGYFLNYSIFCLKSVFRRTLENNSKIEGVYLSIRPALKLFQNIVTYPFSLNMHQFQIQDDIHQNISGLMSEIYFPSYFRNLLCDTGMLLDLINYYSKLNLQAHKLDPIRQDIYSLIRIIGRVMSTSQYIFVGEQQKKAFRGLSVNFITKVLKQNKFYDTYLIMCISKINIKFMSIENEDQMFEGKRDYFNALNVFICNGVAQCEGKIQDGDKHPLRQLFQVLTAFVNITANTILDQLSKNCAQEALNILLKVRLINNVQNEKMMKQFGFNNSQQIDCFGEIFARVPEIFKINLAINLTILDQLNLSALNSSSLTFWLHLTALLLPQHDTSIEQTQLIIKFLSAAIDARSIASLHFIQTLMSQVLYQIKDGISTTYLWKFIQESKTIRFEQFLLYIINYAMKILTVPNYTLIQNCLELFKIMFTKLCKFRHKSFGKYFQIIEQVCKEIDKTMLVHPDYIKLRINFFSIISIIWVSQGQLSFVYRIFNNIRQSLGQHTDFIHFLRYMTDITGLLQPVESSEVYKILLELILLDMQSILPFYFKTPEQLHAAFSSEVFLKTFIKFLLTLVTDNGYRITFDIHTELPFLIEETFRPYLIQVLKYDYPQKTIQTWLKFMRLNPLGKLLPLDKSMKQKNSPHYKMLLREYFQNLHRLSNMQEFLQIYSYVDDNIELMVDWWEEIIVRGYKPNINVQLVVRAHIWTNVRQKESLGKLLYRIGKYDSSYWHIQFDAPNQNKYTEWFVKNYE